MSSVLSVLSVSSSSQKDFSTRWGLHRSICLSLYEGYDHYVSDGWKYRSSMTELAMLQYILHTSSCMQTNHKQYNQEGSSLTKGINCLMPIYNNMRYFISKFALLKLCFYFCSLKAENTVSMTSRCYSRHAVTNVVGKRFLLLLLITNDLCL